MYPSKLPATRSLCGHGQLPGGILRAAGGAGPRFMALLITLSAYAVAAAQTADKPAAIIFGQSIYAKDLTVPASVAKADAATVERALGEALRARVWKAVFDDYARRRSVEATEAELNSQIEGHRRSQARLALERANQREALIAELKSPDLGDARRKAAQQHLDTLDRLAQFDARRAQELNDPAQQKIHRDSERRVAQHWVRSWKLNQALFREFGGRIVFQQAGWEPIDAYRKLLERVEADRQLVIADPAWRAAVYRYFEHRFVYADEAKGRFYFDKPYWERTPEEMRAAGF